MCRGFGLLVGAVCLTGMIGLNSVLMSQPLQDLESQLQANPPERVEPGYLGVVTDDRAEQGQGVRVTEVVPDGPAAIADLRTGDLIIAANGVAVRRMDDLAAVIERTPAGGKIQFDVYRNRQLAKLSVQLGKRPAPGERRFEEFGPVAEVPIPPAPGLLPPPKGVFGITVAPVTNELRQRFLLGNAQGVLIVEVLPGTPAADAKLQMGDLILSVAGNAIATADDLAQQLSQVAGEKVGLVVLRGGRPLEVLAPVPGEIVTRRPAANGQDQPDDANVPRPQPPSTLPFDERGRIEILERRVMELEAELREMRRRLDLLPAASR